MGEMYNRIVALCKERGIKPGRVCTDTGLSRGMMSDLKMGRTKELSAKNTKIIADYFGVTTDYLLTGEDTKKEPGLTEKDRRDVAKMVDGKITIDDNACNHCGRCIGKCPFHAVEDYTDGYRIYIGGRWGKKVARGRYLDKVFTDKDEVLAVVEKAILLFREQGITGERFADTVARLGFENVQEQLLSNDLLTRKEENLKAQKHLKGGATC